MTTFFERITTAFTDENRRREIAGEPRLTKTALWRAAGCSSSACSHWFNGANAMDWNAARLTAPLLRVNPYWLYDESYPRNAPLVNSADQPETTQPPPQHLRERVQKLVDLTAKLSDDGVQTLIGQALLLLKDYPRETEDAAPDQQRAA